jgi:hypothetical protein
MTSEQKKTALTMMKTYYVDQVALHPTKRDPDFSSDMTETIDALEKEIAVEEKNHPTEIVVEAEIYRDGVQWKGSIGPTTKKLTDI